jgi:hypothetical protein
MNSGARHGEHRILLRLFEPVDLSRLIGVDVVDIADIAVVDLLVVIVFDLHDLVAGSKGLSEPLHFAIAGGIESIL